MICKWTSIELAQKTKKKLNMLVICYYLSYECSIRHITAEVGAAVMRAAVAEELAEGHGDTGPRELQHMSKVRSLLSNSTVKTHSFSIISLARLGTLVVIEKACKKYPLNH